jgi:hypothetical protein
VTELIEAKRSGGNLHNRVLLAIQPLQEDNMATKTLVNLLHDSLKEAMTEAGEHGPDRPSTAKYKKK